METIGCPNTSWEWTIPWWIWAMVNKKLDWWLIHMDLWVDLMHGNLSPLTWLKEIELLIDKYTQLREDAK